MHKTVIMLLIMVVSAFSEKFPVTYKGGVFHAPVVLNDSLRLEFIIDSGAAMVHIPSGVFEKLIRTGTLKKEDIIRKEQIEIASGEVFETIVVNIKKMKIGNTVMRNVEATIGANGANLLLGQSALVQLEPWSISTRDKIMTISGHPSYSMPPSEKNKIFNSSKIKTEELFSFIDEYLYRGNRRDVRGIVDLYAKRADYFDSGAVSRSSIIKKRQKYYRKWTKVQIDFIKMRKIENITGYPNQKLVEYLVKFDIYSHKKHTGIRGTAINTMILEKINGSLYIIADKQKILNKKRY